jgi:hypothetical protein
LATNFYFNNFQNSQEQQLIEDLVIESIKVYGLDLFYLPRTILHKNEIFREQDSASFNSSYGIEMYIKNIDNFGGDGKFLSKFGLEIRDEIVFTVAFRTFNNEITQINGQTRPNEGDLIWLPLNQKVFQIKFVDHEAIFYQLGSLQMYDLTCELFEYSNETFNTGISDIDDKYASYSTDMSDYSLMTQDGFELTDSYGNVIVQNYNLDSIDDQSQIDIFTDEAADFVDFSEGNPFSEAGVY